MTLSATNADAKLNADLNTGTGYLWLHTATPGAAGTLAVAQTSVPADIVRKAISVGAPGNHATNTERRVLSDAAVSWAGADIASGQEITHASIWSAVSAGTVLYIFPITTPKTTGSDGVTIATGDLEVALTVFAKPA